MVMREERVTRDRGGVRSDRAIYVNIDGDEVRESDPRVHAMAYAAGAMVPRDDAVRYGLAKSGDFEGKRRNQETEDNTAFVDAADHRRLMGELDATRRRLNEATDALDAKDAEIERLSAEIDNRDTKVATGAGKETKPDQTESKPAAGKPATKETK